MELPQPITDDLFNLNNHIPDMAVDHIADEIKKYGFVVPEVTISKMLLKIRFEYIGNTAAEYRAINLGAKSVGGTITINRLEQLFSIEARGDGIYLPISGTWDDMAGYLANLQHGTN